MYYSFYHLLIILFSTPFLTVAARDVLPPVGFEGAMLRHLIPFTELLFVLFIEAIEFAFFYLLHIKQHFFAKQIIYLSTYGGVNDQSKL